MNVDSHLLKADRNKTFLHKFLMGIIDKCPDWVSIVAFYCALHFIEAFLKKNHGLDFKHHEERHTFLSHSVPKRIFSAYYRLYDYAFNSRYKALKDAPTCDEANSSVQFDLADVESFVRANI
ncbi:hypothetical protein KAU88_07585 [Candidatus Bathyarchaeota archaeon]|nr:hypothetical protein [Candidatus Bathyarchaeota archaeon]